MTTATDPGQDVGFSTEDRNFNDLRILSGTTLTLEGGDILNGAEVCGGILNVKNDGTARNISIISAAIVMEALVIESLPGKVYVYSGGTIRNTLVDDGHFEIYSGGKAYDTVVLNGTVVGNGYLDGIRVSSGAKVKGNASASWENVIVNGGNLNIENAGVASQVVINRGGSSYFWYGALLKDVTVNSGGSGEIYYNGRASNMTVNNRGSVVFSQFGSAGGITVRYGGSASFSADNVLTDVIAIAGAVTAPTGNGGGRSYNADAKNATFRFDVCDTVPGNAALLNNYRNITGGAYQIQVRQKQNPGTYTLIYDGFDFNQSMELFDTTGKSLGALSWSNAVIHGSYADFRLNLNATGQVELVVTDTHIGTEDIHAPTIGTRMYSWVLQDSDVVLYWEYAHDNVAVDHYEIRRASQSDFSDAVTISVTPSDAAFGALGGNVNMTVISGLKSGDWYWELTPVDAAGNRGPTLTGGNFIVPDIQQPNYTDVETGQTYTANVTAAAGTVIRNGKIQGSAKLTVASGGGAENFDLGADGRCLVEAGGVISGATVSTSGNYFDGYGLVVKAGASAYDAVLRDYAYEYVYGYDSGTLVDNSSQFVYGSSLAAEVRNSGCQEVHGVAKDTVISATGSQYLEGIAINTVVSSGGLQFIWGNGAGILNTYVHSGGMLSGGAHGSLAGEIRLGGALITRSELDASNALVIFDLSERNAQDDAIIDDLAKIKDGSYRVYIDSKQTAGAYKLAANASAFTGSITVVGKDAVYGEVSLGNALDVDGSSFTLSNGNGVLQITVKGSQPDLTAPIITVTPSTAAPTDRLTLTAVTDDGSPLYYSSDERNWSAYTGAITVTANSVWHFKATDAAGNTGTAQFTVTNIIGSQPDTTPPEKPIASADVTSPTNGAVKVSAVFSADSAQKQYSFDNREWRAYTSGVVMTANGTVYFRGVDAAGNISEVASYTVSNITTAAPDKPTVTADVTAPTNGKVTVTAVFSADSVTKQYSLDLKTWRKYTTGVVLTVNATVYFRGVDATGNASEIAEYEVANIDKVAPDRPAAKADITTKTTGNVTVTASFSADSVVKQYSTDQMTWQEYTTGVVMSKNGRVYFRGIDEAGNISEITSYKVSNIGVQTVTTDLSASGEIASGQEEAFTPKLPASGLYTVTGTFGTGKGTVTVVDKKTGRKVGSGTVKNGVVILKKELLLDNANSYTVIVKNTDKKSDGAAYEVKLTATELFTKGDNTDDTKAKAQTLAVGGIANDWVGYGDAVDYWKLGVDARGGFYDLSVSGVRNNVRLTIYAADGRKVKGVTVSAKKPAAALANLCLANGSYAVIEAPKAAKAKNSDYQLKLTEKAVFTGAKNNDWAQAEVLAPGATFAGALTKAVGGDVVDYCDVSQIDALTFDMTAGKTKVSFFDAQHNAVKTTVKLANGADKTAASLTLAAGNAVTDNFTISAIDDAVKYLKIEAAGKALNGYSITKIA